MSKGKLGIWLKDNLVFLTGIPLIIGVHWGWYKLQEVPYLVDQSDRKKEFPLFSAMRAVSYWALEGVEEKTGTEPTSKAGNN